MGTPGGLPPPVLELPSFPSLSLLERVAKKLLRYQHLMNEASLRVLKALDRGLLAGVHTSLSPSRRLLLVEGRDARTFLNGLFTQQLNDAGKGGHICHYGAFLTVKGRVLSDAFVYERPGSRDFLLDVDAQVAEPLRAHLERHRVRAQVRIDGSVSDLYTLHTLVAAHVDARDQLLRNLLNRGDLGHAMGLYVDPRFELCLRVFAPVGASLPLDGVRVHTAASRELYDYARLLHGVYEGASELPAEKALPLEAQLQHNAGVHFHKGCYLGQELVARTFHKGELHKALFTLRRSAAARTWQPARHTLLPAGFLDDSVLDESTRHVHALAINADTHWTTAGGARSGRVFARALDLAVGHVRFEHLTQPDAPFALGDVREECTWRVVYPPWWTAEAL